MITVNLHLKIQNFKCEPTMKTIMFVRRWFISVSLIMACRLTDIKGSEIRDWKGRKEFKWKAYLNYTHILMFHFRWTTSLFNGHGHGYVMFKWSRAKWSQLMKREKSFAIHKCTKETEYLAFLKYRELPRWH